LFEESEFYEIVFSSPTLCAHKTLPQKNSLLIKFNHLKYILIFQSPHSLRNTPGNLNIIYYGVLLMTTKNFLYSASAFALALQISTISPSFAMDDNDKEKSSKISLSLTLSPEIQVGQATAHVRKECNYLKDQENQLIEKQEEINALFPKFEEGQYSFLDEYANEAMKSNNFQRIEADYINLVRAESLFLQLESESAVYYGKRAILAPLAKIFGITTLEQPLHLACLGAW